MGRRQNGEPRPIQQGAPDLEGGSVESQRRQLQMHLRRPHVGKGVVDDQPHHTSVRDEYALGVARRSGRIHDVRGVLGTDVRQCRILRRRERLLGHGTDIMPTVLIPERRVVLRHQRRLNQHQRRRAVLINEPQQLAGIRGVERHIGGARFEDPENRGNRVHRTLGIEADTLAAADTLHAERGGDSIRPLGEFSVGHSSVFAEQGDLARHSTGEFGECGVNRLEFHRSRRKQFKPSRVVATDVDFHQD